MTFLQIFVRVNPGNMSFIVCTDGKYRSGCIDDFDATQIFDQDSLLSEIWESAECFNISRSDFEDDYDEFVAYVLDDRFDRLVVFLEDEFCPLDPDVVTVNHDARRRN